MPQIPENLPRGSGALSDSTVVKVTFKNSKTKKTTSKKYRCVVKAAKDTPDTPVEEALAISEVKQTASNAINVTFNKDVSKEVTAENLTIFSDNAAALQLAVKSITFSADGKSANVVIFGNFIDGTTYKVSYTTLEATFPASVGAVTNVTINTTTAQQNVATPIKFQLFDANGIDVTPSINLDAYTSITISGNYATAEINKPSTAKITLDTIGMIATVTVTYNANTADSVDVSTTQDITCVDAKAMIGKALFAVAKDSDVNKNSQCAKFYQGLSDTSAKVAVGASASSIYFCATDDNGDVISYDSYDVESSNDNIVIASVTKDTGKYAIITAGGNNIGSAQLNITATKNGKATYYVIPVTTYKKGLATKMTVETTRTSMSDSIDPDYSATITAKLYDAADELIETGSYIGECKTDAAVPAEIQPINVSNTKKGEFKVTAHNATAKTYTFEISGSDNIDNSKAIMKRITISVSKLPNNLQNVSYQLEVTKPTLDIAKADERTTKVRLYAICNGLFAGYVRHDDFTKIGGKSITDSKQQIQSVSASAIFGTVTLDVANSSLVATGDAITAADMDDMGSIVGFDLNSVMIGTDGDSNSVNARPDGKGDVARTGSYTIRFDLKLGSNKVVSKTAGITVKNSYTQPTIKVLSTKVDTLTPDAIINDGHLSTNVDMNNDTNSYVSILSFFDANYNEITSATNTKGDRMTVRYASVVDNIGDEVWIFYVPVNATFIQN